jgi:hypothetical protein
MGLIDNWLSAQWQVEGGKSTSYVCNLEKRHYLEKTIPNLILDNDIETSDQNVIQSELQLFYKKIYSSTEPIINKSHVDLPLSRLSFKHFTRGILISFQKNL